MRAELITYLPMRNHTVSYSLFATVHYKDECIKQILFSPDSSLMVLVHEGALSLWDPTAVHSGRNAPSFLKVLPGEGLALDEAVFAGASHIAVRATAGKRDASHGVCVVYDLTSCECELDLDYKLELAVSLILTHSYSQVSTPTHSSTPLRKYSLILPSPPSLLCQVLHAHACIASTILRHSSARK